MSDNSGIDSKIVYKIPFLIQIRYAIIGMKKNIHPYYTILSVYIVIDTDKLSEN